MTVGARRHTDQTATLDRTFRRRPVRASRGSRDLHQTPRLSQPDRGRCSGGDRIGSGTSAASPLQPPEPQTSSSTQLAECDGHRNGCRRTLRRRISPHGRHGAGHGAGRDFVLFDQQFRDPACVSQE